MTEETVQLKARMIIYTDDEFKSIKIEFDPSTLPEKATPASAALNLLDGSIGALYHINDNGDGKTMSQFFSDWADMLLSYAPTLKEDGEVTAEE
jgi:hypothetical protein